MTDLLVFGVDGMNPEFTQKMIDEGEMPALERLQDTEDADFGSFKSFVCEGYEYPHTGPCLTPDVRAYTKEGLKNYEDIEIGDEVLSISENQEVQWKKVTEKMVREHKGTVYDIKHSKASATVTPDHNLAVRNEKDKIERVKASLLPSKFEVPTHGKQTPARKEVNEKTAVGLDFPKTEDYAEFLGWFIADGNINGNEIRISKIIEEDREKIKDAIRKLGDYEPSERQTNICFYAPELAEELEEKIGKKSIEREIPNKYLSRWTHEQLRTLYETLVDADGARQERNKYHTSSKKLAYDFAELCIRLGFSPHVENRGGGKQEIKGETYEVEDRYRVHIAREDNNTEIRKHRHWTEKDYNGKVWDLEVEDNHTFLVERNGKLHFTGNCWTSLYTGLKPEEHGLLSGGWNDGDSKFHTLNTVWDELGEAGHSVFLYGMPMTYKAKPVNGRMVSGFISTTLKSLWSNCVYPDSFEDELPDDFMEYTSSYVAKVRTDGAKPDTDTEDFYTELSYAESERLEQFLDVYSDGEEDVVAYGTTLVDKIGHVAGINKDSRFAREAYSFLDLMLDQILEAVQPEDVVIVSDHGFSDFSHDLEGYALDTTGQGLDNIFDLTPCLMNYFNLDYVPEEFGPVEGENQDLTESEIEDVKDQLDALGYF